MKKFLVVLLIVAVEVILSGCSFGKHYSIKFYENSTGTPITSLAVRATDGVLLNEGTGLGLQQNTLSYAENRGISAVVYENGVPAAILATLNEEYNLTGESDCLNSDAPAENLIRIEPISAGKCRIVATTLTDGNAELPVYVFETARMFGWAGIIITADDGILVTNSTPRSSCMVSWGYPEDWHEDLERYVPHIVVKSYSTDPWFRYDDLIPVTTVDAGLMASALTDQRMMGTQIYICEIGIDQYIKAIFSSHGDFIWTVI